MRLADLASLSVPALSIADSRTTSAILPLIPSIRHRAKKEQHASDKKWMLPAFSKVRHFFYWIPLELMNQELFPVIFRVRLPCVKHIAHESIEEEVDGP